MEAQAEWPSAPTGGGEGTEDNTQQQQQAANNRWRLETSCSESNGTCKEVREEGERLTVVLINPSDTCATFVHKATHLTPHSA